jgi:hypothetical protein
VLYWGRPLRGKTVEFSISNFTIAVEVFSANELLFHELAVISG